jgi:hypothetical protein
MQDKSERFVNFLAGMLRVRGGGVHEAERLALVEAFDDAVDQRVLEFWNEQHRERE